LAGVGVVDVPLLGGGVEADVRRPDDVEPSERTEINRLGIEAADVAAGIEAEDGWSHWSLVIGHWSLVIGHWSLVIGHWSLVIGHWSLVIGEDLA
jgi:hypothetical protein